MALQLQLIAFVADATSMTRLSPTTIVQAFVILVTVVVFALMAIFPDDSQTGSMSGDGMSGMSGMPAGSHDMTGR